MATRTESSDYTYIVQPKYTYIIQPKYTYIVQKLYKLMDDQPKIILNEKYDDVSDNKVRYKGELYNHKEIELEEEGYGIFKMGELEYNSHTYEWHYKETLINGDSITEFQEKETIENISDYKKRQMGGRKSVKANDLLNKNDGILNM